MNKTAENNDWYEKPKPTPKPAPLWLGIVWQALIFAVLGGFVIATALAIYNYIFPPPNQEVLAANFEAYALLLNGVIGAVVGLLFGFIPATLILMVMQFGLKLPKIWQTGIIGVIVPLLILYGFDILLKAKLNGLLPISQYLLVIIAGIVVGLLVFKPDFKPYLPPKPKAE